MYLVTGGAGFIGSSLVDRLIARGERVVCLDDFNDFYDPQIKRKNITAQCGNPLFTLVEGDIRDSQLVESVFNKHRFSKVVHIAARAGVRPSLQDPILYEEVNIRGTMNLLEQSRKTGVEQFIFASSSSVYGNTERSPFREEELSGRPISPYAATKFAGELMCHTYHHLYGLPTTVLRFFTVYGPRQRPDLAIHKFVRMIRQNRAIPMFGDGSMARDYTYIEDTLQGILAAIDKPFAFETFNLGNSYPITLATLIAELGIACGQEVRIEHLPLQAGDVDNTCADISKAKAMLGYNPAIRFRDGLARFVNWFDREHGSRQA